MLTRAFSSNKLKAQRTTPTYTLTWNKHSLKTHKTTSAACRRKDTRHTHGAKAGRSLLGNVKEIDFFLFVS